MAVLRVLLVALALCACSAAADQLFTVCYTSGTWSVFTLNPDTGVLITLGVLDASTASLIDTTLSHGGDVGIHFNQYLYMSFAYTGGFGEGTVVRRLGTNFQSANNDLLFTASASSGFTGDCNSS